MCDHKVYTCDIYVSFKISFEFQYNFEYIFVVTAEFAIKWNRLYDGSWSCAKYRKWNCKGFLNGPVFWHYALQ